MHTRHQTLTVKKVNIDYFGPKAEVTETTGQVTVRKFFGMKIPVGMSLGRYLIEEWNGTTVFDSDILKYKDAEFSKQSASKLLIYAVRHDDQYGELAYSKAIAKFNSMGKEDKEKAILKMQTELNLNSSLVFASHEKIHAVTVISNFLYEASKSLPTTTDGEKDAAVCSTAVAKLADIVDTGGFWDETNKKQAKLMQAGCRALWELGAGSYEFWERRLQNAPVRDFVITQMLEMPATENMEEHGWSLLQKTLAQCGADIAKHPSSKKEEFFAASLSHSNPEIVRAAFLGALHLEKPSKEILSAMVRPVKAAVGEYASCLKAEPERAAASDAFITEALTSLVSARYSNREHLQPVINELAGFTTNVVLTSTFTDDVPGYTIGKCAQMVALLTRSGALPRHPSQGGTQLTIESDVKAIRKSCEILVKIIDYGNDRQFAVSHDLITIRDWATPEQLKTVALEMASLIAHPSVEKKVGAKPDDSSTEKRIHVESDGLKELKRQKQAKAIAVLGHIYSTGLRSKEITTAFEKEFSEADEGQQLEVLHNIQIILGEHAQEVFANEVDTTAAVVIADLVGAVAKHYPHGTEGKCVSEEYERTVELLRNVAESGRDFNASPLQRLAKTSSVSALYSLGFGEYSFWEGRVNDWVTVDTAVTKILDEGFESKAGRARKKLLKANLADIHPLVWENPSEAKISFLRCMLKHKEPEIHVAVFHAAVYLPEIPEDFLSSARELLPGAKCDKGSKAVHDAASVFLSLSAAKEQLKQQATVFSAAHTVIDLYAAGNSHLQWAVQRIGFELVPAVFPLGGENVVQLVEGENAVAQANIVTPDGFSFDRQRVALTVIGKIGMLGVPIPGITFIKVQPEQVAEAVATVEGASSGGPLTEGIAKAARGIGEELKILANPTFLPSKEVNAGGGAVEDTNPPAAIGSLAIARTGYAIETTAKTGERIETGEFPANYQISLSPSIELKSNEKK